MEKSLASLFLVIVFTMVFLPLQSNAISQCNGPCGTQDDCDGELICINGKCNDDPEVGSNVCGGGGGGDGGGGGGEGGGGGSNCQSSGTLTCNGESYPTYSCSPPVTTSTKAKLTNNDFSEGGDGGDPSKCDERYHDNSDPIVALSTGWYNEGSRCGKMIKITALNEKSVMAKVVDECDSMHGCDSEHADQPPCDNNIVDGSDAVWSALGLDKNDGVADVTWSIA